MTTNSDNTNSPWHKGEQALQEKSGALDRMNKIGPRFIRPYMPDEHREFFNQLPFVVAGSVDRQGDAWASIISGHTGFTSSPTPTSLDISTPLDPNDPVTKDLQDGTDLAILGIELETRRRNRVNGSVTGSSNTGFNFKVEHSFGNCPQYIQAREVSFTREPHTFSNEPSKEQDKLDADLRTRITRSDTFFVSSYANLDTGRQVDVSHRGGKPGFVDIDDNGLLTIPDYAGNLFFNTLGNFITNPKAGLVFPDFESGDLLHLSGDAEIIFDSPKIDAFEGAQRLWTFMPRRILLRRNALPFTCSFKDFSPNLKKTGSWEDAEKQLQSNENKSA